MMRLNLLALALISSDVLGDLAEAITVTIPVTETAWLNPSFPNSGGSLGGVAAVQQQFHPHNDTETLLKFDISTLNLANPSIDLLDASLSIHHYTNEAGTPADYTSYVSVITNGYHFGHVIPEATIDNWNHTAVTPSSYGVGFWHNTNPTHVVADSWVAANDFLTITSTPGQKSSLKSYINADTNGIITLVLQGGGTPNEYPFLSKAVWFNEIALTVTTTAIPEPSSAALATLAFIGAMAFARRKSRRQVARMGAPGVALTGWKWLR